MADHALAWIDDALAKWDARGLRRQLSARSGAQSAGGLVLAGKTYINFGSNDYLGLASESLLPAVKQCLDEVGWGAGASPLVTGRGNVHAELERQLAAFEATEAALLFTTGYAANVGTIAALVGSEDAIFSDAKNHASIIDGCRLSGARTHIYRHADAQHLHESLRQFGAAARRRLIVTDGLFSMDGDLAPLDRIVPLAEEYQAMLLVDEAHATGVLGPRGRGICEYFGVEERVSIRVGTLSKALGSHGGFVVGSQALVDWLANRGRAYVFSTAAPEALAAAGLEALRIVRDEPQRRKALLSQAEQLREWLRARGLNIGNSQSQIVPIVLGDAARTMQAAQWLRERGLWVPGIRPPSVPEGESLLRISLSYAHTPEMIEQLQGALAEVL